MPYLEPDEVLRRFSSYALEEIRPALREDEEFMRGQVGSMASTLRFLASELDGLDDAVAAQREALIDALAVARDAVEDPEVEAELAAAANRVAAADGDPRSVERTVLEAASDSLAAVDGLPPDAARQARRPLYEFLDERVRTQLGLLGRSEDG